MISGPVTFELLQARFVAGLDRRFTQLTTCVGVLRDSHSLDEETIANVQDDLMRSFHSLAGTAGTYGYHELTDIARLGDVLCRDLTVPPSSADMAMLEFIVESLASAASISRAA